MELQSLPTVPAGNVAGMIVSLLVAFGLPIGLYLYLKHKKYARTSSFVTGMLVFILFAMVLETAVHSLVFSLTGTALTGNLFLYAVYAALMAAAFEETGRYLAMRFVLRYRFDGKNALMYGAGHGGAEAMILLGLTSINNLVNTALINSGSLPDVLSGLDEATLESVLGGVAQLWTAPAYIFFVAGFERTVAICLHIALSVLVWRAVRDRKASWYWAAFGGHFAVDFAAVIMPNYSILLTEALFALMTAAVAWYAVRAYREAAAE